MKISALDFTNILGAAAFAGADPESAKKTYNLTVYFALWDLCS